MATLLSPTGSFSGRNLAPFVCPSHYCNLVPSFWDRRLAAESIFVVELRCPSPDGTSRCRGISGSGPVRSRKTGDRDNFREPQAGEHSPLATDRRPPP